MSSTSIYTPIKPTYLYIKQHSITGLKYFGKTTQDPYKYTGSGSYWKKHIKKHDKQFVVTLWVSELYYDTSIVDIALHFSNENNIVESSDWANLITENGLDGGNTIPWNKGRTGIQVPWNKGKSISNNQKNDISNSMLGKQKSNQHRTNISVAMTGKTLSESHKLNVSIAKKGIPSPKKGISLQQVVCPHCGKTGAGGAMLQWHFDKCKFLSVSQEQGFFHG